MGKPNPCCDVESNLSPDGEPVKIKGMTRDGHPLTGTASVRKCRVCGARHHEVSADPGHFGLKGQTA